MRIGYLTVLGAMIEDDLATVLARKIDPITYAEHRAKIEPEPMRGKLSRLQKCLPPKHRWASGHHLHDWLRAFTRERNNLAHSIVYPILGTSMSPGGALLRNKSKPFLHEVTPEIDESYDLWRARGDVLSIVLMQSARSSEPDFTKHDLRALATQAISPDRIDQLAALDEIFPK